jgi:hypothetical protein
VYAEDDERLSFSPSAQFTTITMLDAAARAESEPLPSDSLIIRNFCPSCVTS